MGLGFLGSISEMINFIGSNSLFHLDFLVHLRWVLKLISDFIFGLDCIPGFDFGFLVFDFLV